jgi:hypothetical protein
MHPILPFHALHGVYRVFGWLGSGLCATQGELDLVAELLPKLEAVVLVLPPDGTTGQGPPLEESSAAWEKDYGA